MRIFCFPKVRQTGLDAHEGAARIDLVHKIEPFHGGLQRPAQADGAGIVDQDVNAPESDRSLVHSGLHGVCVPNVDRQRQRLTAGLLDLLGGCKDGTRQLGMRLPGFGHDHDMGAVTGRPQGDGLANSPAAAGYEQGFFFEHG